MTIMSVFSLPNSGEGKKTAAQIRSDRIFIKGPLSADPRRTTLFYTWPLIFTFVAGPKPQPGTALSHTSVACGTKKSKKQDIDLLCQQYVVRSNTADYTIRQPKPDDQHLIPLNTAIEFNLDKNKMKFKVNGKSFQFVVISQAAASSAGVTPAP